MIRRIALFLAIAVAIYIIFWPHTTVVDAGDCAKTPETPVRECSIDNGRIYACKCSPREERRY